MPRRVIGGVVYEEWTEVRPVRVVAVLRCVRGEPPPKATLTLDGVTRTAILRAGGELRAEKLFRRPGTYTVRAVGTLANAAGRWSRTATAKVTVSAVTRRRRIGIPPAGTVTVTPEIRPRVRPPARPILRLRR